MARHQLSLDLDTTTDTETTPAPTPGRQVVLHVHLSDQAITAPNDRLHLARVANTRSFVDADQVREWCRAPGVQVSVKPVLDLAEHLHVDQYQVPDRLADQATERDLTCVFPWCTRPAEHCDTDHVIPYSEGGPTASDNLAPLCRRHHRLKTHHTGWGYTVLEPGSYLWHSPHGYQFLRDHRGTTDVTRDQTSHPPDQ
jgi:5-methylcytosine-specific restriction endonuclease McrA